MFCTDNDGGRYKRRWEDWSGRVEGICGKESNYLKEHDSSIFKVCPQSLHWTLNSPWVTTICTLLLNYWFFTWASIFQGNNYGIPKLCAAQWSSILEIITQANMCSSFFFLFLFFSLDAWNMEKNCPNAFAFALKHWEEENMDSSRPLKCSLVRLIFINSQSFFRWNLYIWFVDYFPCIFLKINCMLNVVIKVRKVFPFFSLFFFSFLFNAHFLPWII